MSAEPTQVSAATLQIEYLPIGEVRPRAGNPRTHTEGQISQVLASMREFGFTNPLLLDSKGVLIAGHCRYEAARRLQLKEVPTIRLSQLSAEQARAYVIADNKLALNGGWDMDALHFEVDYLKACAFDVSLLGFSADDLRAICIGATPGEMPQLASGDAPVIEQMTFTLHRDQAAKVREAMDAASEMGAYIETGNENRNGNAIARVAELFLKGWVHP